MPDRPTNILLITSDQQHYDTLGVTNPHIHTPNLDRLAKGGTRFNRAYCPNPTCTPTRASIITGQYPSTHGAWSLGCRLDDSRPTIGDILQRAGYDCSLIGKAHFHPLADDPHAHGPPDAQGFPPGKSYEAQPFMRDLDFWRGWHGPFYGFNHVELTRNHADESHAGQHYALWLEAQGLANWRDYFMELDEQTGAPAKGCKRRYGAWDLPEELHYTRWTAERAAARIEHAADTGQPFFCWASFHDPHPPYTVPEPWASMYDPADMPVGAYTPGELDDMPCAHRMTKERDADWSVFAEANAWNHGYHYHDYDPDKLRHDTAIYYGMISFMDQQIGRLLDTLDARGLADDTLVVFTTDHGHFLGQHGLTAKGGFHYEDLIRVPFLARHPGHIPAGGTSEALQSLVDLAPTFANAAGVEVPVWMQGVDQSAVWRGEQDAARDDAFVEFRHQPTAIHLRTYVTDRYKLTLHRDAGGEGEEPCELFDLHDDPGELTNRWRDPAYAVVKAGLMEAMLHAELRREYRSMPRVAGA